MKTPFVRGGPMKRADGTGRGRAGEGLYAYCVLLDPEGFDPATAGLEGDSPVSVVPCRRLGMVVRRVPLSEFDPGRVRAKLQDWVWLESRVRRHEALIEKVMRHRPVAPIRFGTVYLDEAGVRDFLAKNERELLEGLKRLAGKEEWNVRAYVEWAALRASAEGAGGAQGRASRETEGGPPGRAYLLRKKRDLLLAEGIDRRAGEWEREWVGRLRGSAEGVALNEPLGAREARDGKEMVLNAACLVAKDRWPEFRRTLEALSARYGKEGCSFRCTGPWPPYNFSPRGREMTGRGGRGR